MVRGDGLLGSYSYERAGRKNTDEHRFRLALTDIEALRRARAYLQEEEVATTERVVQLATGTRREVSCIVASRRQPVERVRDLMEWPVLPSLDWCRGFLAGISDAQGSRTDHSITRKRSIEGQMVKSFANLQVAAIEPLDQVMPLYDITTGTGDFIAGGVVSHNCFARPTHTYLDFNAGRDFEREIVVKVNAPELLRAELMRPSWKHEHVALGTNTDPYQWVEGRYKLMPGIWEAMRDAGNPCSVLTKSPLLLRDLSLMQEIAARTDFSAALSVPTLDERAWRATEPHTPHPRARLEAVAELTRAGIRTGILVAPLMPGINDAPEQVAAILEMASEAGAAYVTGIALHLRGEVRGLFFAWLEEHRPDLVPRYKELYRRGAYAPPEERRRLAALVKGPDLPPGQRMRGSTGHPPARAAPVHEPDQRSLF
jgi:DNA repair photolyase